MSDRSNNVFYDERINGIPGPPPCPDMWIPGRPPYEHPGPCCPDAPIVNPYAPGVPNPVPSRYWYPVPRRRYPGPCRPEEFFVLKRELNEVLKNIAKNDIYNDKSENGTTVTVGGIPKGTKLGKISFADFIPMLLFPEDGSEIPDIRDLVSKEELETTLSDYATTSALEEVSQSIPSLIYPDGKKTEVINNIGGFKAGDSLEGMNIFDIIEKLLCEQAN